VQWSFTAAKRRMSTVIDSSGDEASDLYSKGTQVETILTGFSWFSTFAPGILRDRSLNDGISSHNPNRK
jgi:hypothetical protein